MLIGTAVVGATTMIFSIILLLGKNLAGGIESVISHLSLVQPEIAFGLLPAARRSTGSPAQAVRPS